jgi:hypothetical protein
MGGDSIWVHLERVPGVDRIIRGTNAAEVEIPVRTPGGDYKYGVTVWDGPDPIFVDPRLMVSEEGDG